MSNKIKIYVVQHYQGMDGTYIEAIFSRKEDAHRLVDMYRKTIYFDDTYNRYFVEAKYVDNKPIKNYRFIKECGVVTLKYTKFNRELRKGCRRLVVLGLLQ